MKTTTFAIWMEARTGQRLCLASSTRRSCAQLVGEALWAHARQLRVAGLDLRQIEVQVVLPPGETFAPPIVARWSAVGEEQGSRGEQPVYCSSCTHQESEEIQETRNSFADFFPPAEAWAAWQSEREVAV